MVVPAHQIQRKLSGLLRFGFPMATKLPSYGGSQTQSPYIGNSPLQISYVACFYISNLVLISVTSISRVVFFMHPSKFVVGPDKHTRLLIAKF